MDFFDHRSGVTGHVNAVELILTGRRIEDTDADGLDDRWEEATLHTRSFGPADDPDHDGYNNAMEQAMGTLPLGGASPLRLDFSRWDFDRARLAFFPPRN